MGVTYNCICLVLIDLNFKNLQRGWEIREDILEPQIIFYINSGWEKKMTNSTASILSFLKKTISMEFKLKSSDSLLERLNFCSARIFSDVCIKGRERSTCKPIYNELTNVHSSILQVWFLNFVLLEILILFQEQLINSILSVVNQKIRCGRGIGTRRNNKIKSQPNEK